MPPNNSTPILERKYRYVLNAVFFHEDNNNYNQPFTAPLYLSNNIGEVVNIFIKPGLNYNASGYANMTGNRYCVILNAWEGYLIDPVTQLWIKAQTLNHEIGHNLSLFHTMLTPSGNICADIEDYCSDTPTRSSVIQNYGFDPCCGWGGGQNCTNNMMDYTGDDAVTPEQLGRIHWTIENEIAQYKTCYYMTNLVNITNFSENVSFIARDVRIPFGSNIVVNNYKGLFVNSENFEINGELEVQNGSILLVNPVPSCNE